MSDDIMKVLTEPTVDVVLAGRVLGVGRNSAYKALRAGEIPGFKVGGQYRVPTSKLREMLGLPAHDAPGGLSCTRGTPHPITQKPRPARRATAGSRNAFLAARVDGYALSARALQEHRIAHRCRVSPAVAAAIADLLYISADSWRAAR